MRMYMCFFFNDTATTEIYTLSLHDALPISLPEISWLLTRTEPLPPRRTNAAMPSGSDGVGSPDSSSVVRSEEHTSELQSRQYLVCRLLLEKKKNNIYEFFD